jgi:Lon protease-like protein
VVLIRAGAEVGSVDEVAQVGTLARVVDFGQMPDGLLKIVARGERRFRVVARDRQPDGLNLADVEWLDDPVEARLEPDEFPELRSALTDALAQLDEEYPAGEGRPDDAAWVAGHLGQLLPVPAPVRQHLLEQAGARQRLALIEQMRASG